MSSVSPRVLVSWRRADQVEGTAEDEEAEQPVPPTWLVHPPPRLTSSTYGSGSMPCWIGRGGGEEVSNGAKRGRQGCLCLALSISPMAPKSFDQLVAEEVPIQRASVAMAGGMPSCLTLFDEALACYCELARPPSAPLPRQLTTLLHGAALASQSLSVYRHGAPRDCSPKFSDFKFCMSIKALSPERRDEVWVKRRSEMWARRRMGKSSEDVWDARV